MSIDYVLQALSELFRAITALPTDITLITLPTAPLLEVVCIAAQTQLTAVWLSLTTMLTIQLDPPSLLPTTFKSVPTHEAEQIALNVLEVILQASLNVLSQPEAMESVCYVTFLSASDAQGTHRLPISFKPSSVVWIRCVARQNGHQAHSLMSAPQMAQHFVAAFYRLPPNLFNALMQCTVTSLGLQERYSLVGACTFLVSRHLACSAYLF